MNNSRQQSGFSLIEALLATGILGVGLVLIAMVFPVGVKLTSVAAERTIGTIVADEAFAKMQLWGLPATWSVDPALNQNGVDYLTLVNVKYMGFPLPWKTLMWDEFFYPSDIALEQQRLYHWTAVCRRINGLEVQTTVFVTRNITVNRGYYGWNCLNYLNPSLNFSQVFDNPRPSPVPVVLRYEPGKLRQLLVLEGDGNELWDETPGQKRVFDFFAPNTILLDDGSGLIYQVTEVKASAGTIRDTLVLRDDWQWDGYETGAPSPITPVMRKFWVVPPGIGSARNPVIGVVQKKITLE